MTIIYLGMALTGTPMWWRNRFYPMVLEELEGLPGVSVSRFIGLKPDADPTEVHDYDIDLAESADLMVALTRLPSLGLGYEIRSRVVKSLPTLLLQPKDMYLTNMMRGAPHTTLVGYDSQNRDGRVAAKDIAARVEPYL